MMVLGNAVKCGPSRGVGCCCWGNAWVVCCCGLLLWLVCGPKIASGTGPTCKELVLHDVVVVVEGFVGFGADFGEVGRAHPHHHLGRGLEKKSPFISPILGAVWFHYHAQSVSQSLILSELGLGGAKEKLRACQCHTHNPIFLFPPHGGEPKKVPSSLHYYVVVSNCRKDIDTILDCISWDIHQCKEWPNVDIGTEVFNDISIPNNDDGEVKWE